MTLKCQMCHRNYYDGAFSEQVKPLSQTGYCEACAIGAIKALDWLRVQATVTDNFWVRIPLIEWQAAMDDMPCPDLIMGYSNRGNMAPPRRAQFTPQVNG